MCLKPWGLILPLGSLLVAKMIEQASIESIVNTLMIESDKIAITDVIVNSTSPLINRALKDIKFSRG